MNNLNVLNLIEGCLSFCINKDVTLYLLDDANNKKKIKQGKFVSYEVKDNIVRFEFENTLGKHDNNFYISLPYDITYSLDDKEVILSFKNKKLLEIIDVDDLMDLEEQNTAKSPLYNKSLIIKWN